MIHVKPKPQQRSAKPVQLKATSSIITNSKNHRRNSFHQDQVNENNPQVQGQLPPLLPNAQIEVKNETNQSADSLYQKGLILMKTDIKKATEMFKLAAEMQHFSAMYSYAHLLSRDLSTAPTALRIMRTAYKNGQKDALFEYAFMLENGIGCSKNIDEAYSVYQKGIENGDGRAMYRCAIILKGNKNKSEEMFRLFNEAAKLNITKAFFELGICYKKGTGVTKNPTEAARIFKQLADANDPNGMLEYAMCLKNGFGINKDEQKFEEMISKALSTNSPDAKLTYANLLESGDGFPQNIELAEKIYKELSEAEPGNRFAQYCYARALQNRGEFNEAFRYYNMAHQKQHPDALFSIAMLQLKLKQNEEGMKNLKLAADAGNQIAQFNYALYLEKEEKPDKNEIIKYYKMAADSGLPNAICNYSSYIIKKDKKLGISLLKKAADKGHALSQYQYAKFELEQWKQNRHNRRNHLKYNNFDEDDCFDDDLNLCTAIQYFEMASANNFCKAQYKLGLIKIKNNDLDEGMKLLKTSSDAGYSKAISKYQSMLNDNSQGFKKEDPDPPYEYACHIPDVDESIAFYDKYYDDNNPLSKLRRYQLLLKKDSKTSLKNIVEMAKSGYDEAKYVYATLLEEGKYCKKNMLEARKFYQEATKLHHLKSMLRYGKLLKVEDQKSAFILFKEAAERGLPIAQYHYARILEMGGAEEEAIVYYKKAVDAGIVKAMFRYGRIHEISTSIKKSYRTSLYYYKLAAKKGYAKAQNNCGRLYELGLGVSKPNKELAVSLYKKAADQGNVIALHNYARALEKGIGIQKDEAKSASIYKKLADDDPDDGLAQYNYARMCHNGIGLAENLEEAGKYYLLAIDNNIAEAKQNYGVMLFNKFHKWNEAAKFFEMAVSGNGGQPSAKYNYAQLLKRGMGLNEDKKKAESLLHDAAEELFLPAIVAYAELLKNKGEEEETENEYNEEEEEEESESGNKDPNEMGDIDRLLSFNMNKKCPNSNLEKAAAYYKKAAEMEISDRKFLVPQRNAQFDLAMMYKNGKGVAKDNELFIKYLTLAAKNKHPDAESLAEDMNLL